MAESDPKRIGKIVERLEARIEEIAGTPRPAGDPPPPSSSGGVKPSDLAEAEKRASENLQNSLSAQMGKLRGEIFDRITEIEERISRQKGQMKDLDRALRDLGAKVQETASTVSTSVEKDKLGLPKDL